jgi:LacI family transcriptional regulator
MATLLDVAKRAGVSTATVSKVLSNTPYFTEETRDKVMRAVAELGYMPNLAARALSSGRTRIIAVVFPYVLDIIFTDPLVLRILEGIESECSQQGYNILLSTPRVTPDGPDEHYRQLIRSGYIEGVIALDSVPFASVLKDVLDKGIPAIAIGYHNADCNVRSDDYGGGHQQMEYVTRLGHRRIGIISVSDNLHFSIQQRLEGLAAGAAAVGLDFAAIPREDGDFSTQSGARAASSLLSRQPDLTALICLNDRMAMGAIQQAVAFGRHVPDDLTVIGYDDIPMAAAFAPPITTIDQQAPELGRTAVRALFDLLNDKPAQSIVLPTRLVPRQSSARPERR